MYKKIICLFFVISFFICTLFNSFVYGNNVEPEIYAETAILMDMNTRKNSF